MTYTGNNRHNRNINIAAGNRKHIVTTDRYKTVCQLHDKSSCTKTNDVFRIIQTLGQFIPSKEAYL